MDFNKELLKIKESFEKEKEKEKEKVNEKWIVSYTEEAEWVKNKILEHAREGHCYYTFNSKYSCEKEVVRILRKDTSYINGTLKIEIIYFDDEPDSDFDDDFDNDDRVVENVWFSW